MSDISSYATLSTPDSQERAAQRAKQITRGRWLTLFVVVVALGAPLAQLLFSLAEPSDESSAASAGLYLVAVGVACFMLYRGHPWGKKGIAAYLAYVLFRAGLQIPFLLIEDWRSASAEFNSSLEIALYMIFWSLLYALLLAFPITALALLLRSEYLTAFLQRRA